MQAKDYFERAVNVRVALDFDADYAPLAESMKRMAALLEMVRVCVYDKRVLIVCVSLCVL